MISHHANFPSTKISSSHLPSLPHHPLPPHQIPMRHTHAHPPTDPPPQKILHRLPNQPPRLPNPHPLFQQSETRREYFPIRISRVGRLPPLRFSSASLQDLRDRGGREECVWRESNGCDVGLGRRRSGGGISTEWYIRKCSNFRMQITNRCHRRSRNRRQRIQRPPIRVRIVQKFLVQRLHQKRNMVRAQSAAVEIQN